VPGEAVTSHLLTVPPVTRKKWLAMVPWLLEEQLLQRPDELVFQTGAKDREHRVPVLAVSRAQLTVWQQTLAARLPDYAALVPDYFALPWQDGAISLGFRDGRCLVRFNRWQGASGDAGLIMALVKAAKPAQIAVYYQGAKPEIDVADAVAVRYQQVRDLFAPDHGDWLAIAEHRSTQTNTNWSVPAKAAALLLAVLVALLAGTAAVENRQINRQVEFLQTELQRGYQQYFREPYDFAMADFQRVVSARLESSGGGSGAMAAVGKLAQWLASCSSCQVDTVAIADGRLTAQISGAGADQALNRLSQNNPGLSVSRQDDGWRLAYVLEMNHDG
jgi:type II secretion system protein L